MADMIIQPFNSNSEATNVTDHLRNELLDKLQRLRKENQELTFMIKLMSTNYHSLRTQLMINRQEECLRPSPKSMGKTLKLGIDIAEDINNGVVVDYNINSSSSEETSKSSVEKNFKYTADDLQLPCKKRKINYVVEQNEREMKINSYRDEDLRSKEGSGFRSVAMHKKIVTTQTRSETATLNEGRQWRKYGQKMTRNNPWPRAYYRCAIGQSCPVRKQVQKCAQDPSILYTSHKGEHNHLLKPVAMADMNIAATDQLEVTSSSGSLVVGRNQLPFPAAIATISSVGSSPIITLDLTQYPEGFPFEDSTAFKA